LEYRDDKRIIEFAIGLTDLVKRPTRTIEELTREDYAEGRIVLSQKLGEYVPHVIAFNGKSVYEQFAQRRVKLGCRRRRCTARVSMFCLPRCPTCAGGQRTHLALPQARGAGA
jgi:TDG/mug DNA glycosylase family protein